MSNWWAFLSWYENVIVWPLAVGAVVLLLRAKSMQRRVIFGCLLVLVFLPHIQKALGDVYFDYLCRTQAGEFIYETVKDVQGIVELRSRDYSKDFFDEGRKGRFPEDPVGHIALGWGGKEGRAFVIKKGQRYVGLYEYFEAALPSSSDSLSQGDQPFVRFSSFDPVSGAPQVREMISTPLSPFGYTYRAIDGLMMFVLEITGGQTEIVDVRDGRLLAVYRGYLRSGRRYNVCPMGRVEGTQQLSLRTFVTRVLVPREPLGVNP